MIGQKISKGDMSCHCGVSDYRGIQDVSRIGGGRSLRRTKEPNLKTVINEFIVSTRTVR